jgi:hypothetical protein
MKRKGWLNTGVAFLACLGMLISGPVVQAATAEGGPRRSPGGEAFTVTDVALGSGGTLDGQVVDAQGKPLAGTEVAIRHLASEAARTVSDASGRFRVTGLRGGAYEIVAGPRSTVCRLWAAQTAPPSARPAALVVVGDEHVLGQCYPRTCNRLKCWLANPWVIAGIIATAVAIPVALHNCKDDKPHSPS